MKKVATSLATLDSSVPWNQILDPTDDCEELARELLGHWAYDLYERKPRRALLEQGVLTPTDLDLACFLSALGERGAIIDLPTYELRRQATRREGERVVSKDHRHGKVLGLTSNKEVFSFSVRISDLNIVFKAEKCPRCGGDGRVTVAKGDYGVAETCPTCKGEKVVSSPDGEGEQAGAPRNFMLVDLDGTWHDGWKKIVFSPSRKENAFLEDKKLWTGNTIFFDNFVHPNRWVSFYGKWYLYTKLLVERFRAEAAFLGQEISRIQAAGVDFPAKGPDAPREWGASEKVGEARSIKVPAFEVEIDADVPRTFAPRPRTQAGLIEAKKRMNYLRFELTPALNFHVRATELAFTKKANIFAWLDNSTMQHNLEPFPSWISGASWEHGYKVKKSDRNLWSRLVLGQNAPFVKGLALRYRVYEKTERVAA